MLQSQGFIILLYLVWYHIPISKLSLSPSLYLPLALLSLSPSSLSWIPSRNSLLSSFFPDIELVVLFTMLRCFNITKSGVAIMHKTGTREIQIYLNYKLFSTFVLLYSCETHMYTLNGFHFSYTKVFVFAEKRIGRPVFIFEFLLARWIAMLISKFHNVVLLFQAHRKTFIYQLIHFGTFSFFQRAYLYIRY